MTGMGFFLAGCSFADNTLWPVLSGEARAPAEAVATAKAPPGPGKQTAPSSPESVRAAQGGEDRIAALDRDFADLTATIERHDDQLMKARQRRRAAIDGYDQSVTIITTRLRIGATRRDPALTENWNTASRHLARLDTGISDLNTLANDVTASATLSDFLLRTSRAAYALAPPAGPKLDKLVDLENRFTAAGRRVARLLNGVNRDIDTQIIYVARERGKLRALALDVENGAPRTRRAPQVAAGSPEAVRRPLVIIRFDKRDVAYANPLYQAMKAALDRRPDATFDLVAVAPARRTAIASSQAVTLSKQHATAVVKTLTDMGVPMKRLILSQTSSRTAKVSEVHLYIR